VVGWSTPRPGRFTPGKTRYPLYRRLGGIHGRSGQVRKFSLLPGFDLRTDQPVASRYNVRVKSFYLTLAEQRLDLANCITRIIHPTKISFYAWKSDSTEEPRKISRYQDCLGARRLQFDSQEIVRPSTLEFFSHMTA